jgi:hypothetical protein
MIVPHEVPDFGRSWHTQLPPPASSRRLESRLEGHHSPLLPERQRLRSTRRCSLALSHPSLSLPHVGAEVSDTGSSGPAPSAARQGLPEGQSLYDAIAPLSMPLHDAVAPPSSPLHDAVEPLSLSLHDAVASPLLSYTR